MPKKFLVNGHEFTCADETPFDDIREMFKENVTVDDMEDWEPNEDMEKYTAATFIDKARHYLSLSPPDLVQSAEKAWFAAVYAVKELYLTCGGVDLKSHKSLTFFCRFALDCSGLTRNRIWRLFDSWAKAEKMHRDVYGAGNFRLTEYAEIINDVETFVHEFGKFDRKKLWDEFNKMFISGSDPDVEIRKESRTIKLGGYNFKCNYSLFV